MCTLHSCVCADRNEQEPILWHYHKNLCYVYTLLSKYTIRCCRVRRVRPDLSIGTMTQRDFDESHFTSVMIMFTLVIMSFLTD